MIVKPVPTINFQKCNPEKCEMGICQAIKACSHKVFLQEEPYEIPMHDPYMCTGCGICVAACPLKAVKMV